MEITKAERVRLGLFLTIGIIAVCSIVLFYVGRELIVQRTPYFARFNESVAGLNPGAKVKWNGVAVGQVVQVEVDPKHLDYVVVRMEMEPGTPIKASLRANLVGGLSLTGLKSIELSGGDADEPTLPPNSEIPAGTSQFKQITGQAETIVLKTETLMNNLIAITDETNQANLGISLRSISSFTANLDTLVRQNKTTMDSLLSQAKQTMTVSKDAAVEAQKLMSESRATIADLHKEIAELKLSSRLELIQTEVSRTLSAFEKSGQALETAIKKVDVDKTMSGIDAATKSMENATKRADLMIYKAQENFSQSMKYLKDASENMADFSKQIKDNPSVLLRNSEKQGRDR